MGYFDWIENDKTPNSKEYDFLEKVFDICFWGWLSLSSVAASAILGVLPFLIKDNSIVFDMVLIAITLCFIPYYIKEIVSTAKRKESKAMKYDKPSIINCCKKSIIMWPVILTSILLIGLSFEGGNMNIKLFLLSVLTFSIGMYFSFVKSLGE